MMATPLVLVVLAVLVVVVVGMSTRDDADRRSVPDAQRILDRRLAAGELGPDEHDRRVGVLTETRGRDSRPVTGVIVVAGVAVVGLLVAAFAWGGNGWSLPDQGWQMAGHMGWSSGGGSAAAPLPGAVEAEVVATDLRFDPTTVTITAGVPVNLTLINEGRVFHDLTISALDFMLDAESGEQTSGSLTVDEPGTYEFECSVPGHAAAGMRGTLTVEPAA